MSYGEILLYRRQVTLPFLASRLYRLDIAILQATGRSLPLLFWNWTGTPAFASGGSRVGGGLNAHGLFVVIHCSLRYNTLRTTICHGGSGRVRTSGRVAAFMFSKVQSTPRERVNSQRRHKAALLSITMITRPELILHHPGTHPLSP